MSIAYRPSHADRTYDLKYGVRSVQVPSLSLIIKGSQLLVWNCRYVDLNLVCY